MLVGPPCHNAGRRLLDDKVMMNTPEDHQGSAPGQYPAAPPYPGRSAAAAVPAAAAAPVRAHRSRRTRRRRRPRTAPPPPYPRRPSTASPRGAADRRSAHGSALPAAARRPVRTGPARESPTVRPSPASTRRRRRVAVRPGPDRAGPEEEVGAAGRRQHRPDPPDHRGPGGRPGGAAGQPRQRLLVDVGPRSQDAVREDAGRRVPEGRRRASSCRPRPRSPASPRTRSPPHWRTCGRRSSAARLDTKMLVKHDTSVLVALFAQEGQKDVVDLVHQEGLHALRDPDRAGLHADRRRDPGQGRR